MNEIKSILFVCTGNTARSPAAEYLAKFYARKYGLELEIESAGFINAFSYMQPQSSSYLDTKNIDHFDFKPQIVNDRLIKRNTLIITMERSHKADIINTYSDIDNIEEKVYTLLEYNEESRTLDITDPYYTSSKKYAEVLDLIDTNVEKLIKSLSEEF
jgi:protein-tyrosine phosphatase